MDFLDAVFALTFGTEGAYGGEAKYATLAFSISSSFYGSLVVLLDILLVKSLCQQSFLKLSYPGLTGFVMFFMWGFGAGIGALLGAGAGIFEINRLACIVVGTSWPLILPRLLLSSNNELSPEKITTDNN